MARDWIIYIACILLAVGYSGWAIYRQHVSGDTDHLHTGHCYYVADLGLGAQGYKEIPCPT